MRKEKKDEIGMCGGKGIHAREGEIMDQVCAGGKRIHVREGEIMKQVCAGGKGIHAKEGKLWIRYVPEVREYM